MLLRNHVRRLLLAAFFVPVASCALIDGLSGEGASDGGSGGDSGAGGDGGEQGCADEGGCYKQPAFFPTGIANPRFLAIERIDQGTYLDLVVGGDGGATVFFGNGTGGFPSTEPLVESVRVTSLDVGRFNGDGALDIVTYDSDHGLQVFMSNGDGSFTTIPVGGLMPTNAVLAMDLYGDEIDDLLVEQSGVMIPYVNDGAGNFTEGNAFSLASTDPLQFLAAQLTDDSYEDLVQLTPSELYIYLGKDDATFTQQPTLDYTGASALAGWPPPGNDNQVVAILGQCEPCDHSILVEMYNAKIGDIDGRYFFEGERFHAVGGARGNFGLTMNGLALASDHGGEDNLLLLDNWNESFEKWRPLSAGENQPVEIAVGDLNHDAVDDIVVAYRLTDQLGIILSTPP